MNPITAVKERARRLSPASRKGLKGTGWATGTQFAALALRLGSNLILTRLLVPDVFGVLGTAYAVLETLTFFTDIGMLPALIRSPRGTEPAVLMTGWWMNLGRLSLVAATVLAAAWPLAAAYRTPALAPALALLAARPLFLGLRSPGTALLYREMRFRVIYTREIAVQVVSVAASLVLAYFYRSAAAVVLGVLVGAAIAVVISYVLVPMRPALLWDREAARELGRFGRDIFFNTLAMALWMNIDRLLGLRILSAQSMGYYAVAWNLTAALNALTSRVCSGVYYNVLLRQHEANPAARLLWHRRMGRRLVLWGMPVMALGIVLAPLIINILYDPRYRPAGLLLALLIGQSMIRLLNTFEFQYLLSIVAVPVQTRAYLVAAAAQAILLVPLVRLWGVAGMATSVLASATVLATAQAVLMRFKTGRGGYGPLLATLAWVAAGLALLWLVWYRPQG